MKIIFINGSHRANGATGQTLQYIQKQLLQYDSTLEMEYVDLGKYNLKFCTGCLACYKTGACYIKDDGLEELSHKIAESDGVVFGSPTYASNVSGQFKVLIDRGHFIFEQLLRNKACFSVVTYENVGGKAAQKVITELIRFSGGAAAVRYSKRLKHGSNAIDEKATTVLKLDCAKFLRQIHKPVSLSMPEMVMRYFVFNFGLKPHAMKNLPRYQAVVDGWLAHGYM